jgi:hypothetical protein
MELWLAVVCFLLLVIASILRWNCVCVRGDLNYPVNQGGYAYA